MNEDSDPGASDEGEVAFIKKSIASGMLYCTKVSKLKRKGRLQVTGLSHFASVAQFALGRGEGHFSPHEAAFFGFRRSGRSSKRR